MVSALATIFTSTARNRMERGSVCTASMASSVPWPVASGASLVTINADSSAPTVVTRGIAHGRTNPGDPCEPPSPTGLGTW
jgi:hypothetical protein